LLLPCGLLLLNMAFILLTTNDASHPQRTKDTGGKEPIRSHVSEASGSSEAWYVPPRAGLLWPTLGEKRVLARWGRAGEKVDFLSIL
jgi:hypothetical protein